MNKDAQKPPADGTIVVCPDGPILVRGEFEIVTPSGEPVPRQRQTVALCRCGASAIKPYCDGTHKLINFRTEIPESQERGDPAGDQGAAQARRRTQVSRAASSTADLAKPRS